MPARCSSEKLRQQMTLAKMTTPKLIQKSGVSESTIRRILADKAISTSDATIQLLADTLGCSPFDLLRDKSIAEAVKVDADFAVSGVVAEAVMGAVTVVADSVAPDVSPEDVAKAVPDMTVTPPPALDIPSYVEYIKASTDAHVASLRESRNAWRITAVVLFVLLVALVFYLCWEIFHPDNGITRVLWDIYNCPSPTPIP